MSLDQSEAMAEKGQLQPSSMQAVNDGFGA
jgi:hypothetical protein